MTAIGRSALQRSALQRSALHRPALRPLVDELARRLADPRAPASITVPGACRPAVADLLGLDRLPAAGGRVPMARLLDALSVADIAALRREVVAVVGPLGSPPGATRRAELARREELWAWFAAEAATLALGRPLGPWVNAQRARGARGGVDRRRVELSRALAVLRRLPADGLALASLAADEGGGPHGLDHGRTLSAIVLDAVSVATGRPRPANAEDARALWESVGVAPDPLSSTVTVLGLPGHDGPLGCWLEAARVRSEPVTLTLANLRRWPVLPMAADESAFVVENPSLLAEAAAGGWDGPPLVCSSGRPSVAVVTLLRQLGVAGARLYQHADFDPPGLAITAWLAERAGTQPWLMTASEYLHAVRVRDESFDGAPPTPWDPALRVAMEERKVAVYEEDLRVGLLAAARTGRSAGQSPAARPSVAGWRIPSGGSDRARPPRL